MSGKRVVQPARQRGKCEKQPFSPMAPAHWRTKLHWGGPKGVGWMQRHVCAQPLPQKISKNIDNFLSFLFRTSCWCFVPWAGPLFFVNLIALHHFNGSQVSPFGASRVTLLFTTNFNCCVANWGSQVTLLSGVGQLRGTKARERLTENQVGLQRPKLSKRGAPLWDFER